MPFRPILPAVLPDVARLANDVLVDEDGAATALRVACNGATVPRGELVVWAWVFDELVAHVMLVDHPRFGVLLPPGGRVEPDEDPVDAVLRELTEETGIRPHRINRSPVLVDRVVGQLEDGETFQTFGLAFSMEADQAAILVSEPDQPAGWYRLDQTPSRVSTRHWMRITTHATHLRAEQHRPGDP